MTYDENGDAIISVALHKTSTTYGPAHVVVLKEILPLISNLRNFNKHLEFDVDNDSSQRSDRKNMLFRSSYGVSITSSDINR